MKCIFRSMKLMFVAIPALLLYTGSASAQHYKQTNLVSDVVGQAPVHDPNLINPWGLSRSSGSPWWVSDNNAGVSTLYTGTGQIVLINKTGIVTIPAPKKAPAGTVSAPTGTVFNGSSDFRAPERTTSGVPLCHRGWNNLWMERRPIGRPGSGSQR